MTLVLDFEQVAEQAGLEYVFDDAPGLRRLLRGRGFTYVDAGGKPVNASTREWIRSLVIPPAWTDVWIAPVRNAHILATGYDQAGRKQYLYHPDWAEAANDLKFERMASFGRHLTRLRRRMDADLRRPGLDRQKVTALAVCILDQTLIRVGNRRYARENDSYGLTTLGSEHVEIAGSTVRFEFTGKGGADHDIALRDRRLAALVARCQDLSGDTLFSFETESGVHSLNPSDLNTYIGQQSRARFTAKDFRTWGASAVAVESLATANGNADLLAAIDAAAERLGNTRSVCRASYIHPAIPASFEDGRLQQVWSRCREGRWLNRSESALRQLLSSG